MTQAIRPIFYIHIFVMLLVCNVASGMDIPLPDPGVLSRPLIVQGNGKKDADDPEYDKAMAGRIISGGGYSFTENAVSRLDWAYSLDQYNQKILTKQIEKTFKVKKVYDGIVDDEKITTWYDEGKGIWIRLSYHMDAKKKRFGIRVEIAGRKWVGPGMAQKFLDQYPLPK